MTAFVAVTLPLILIAIVFAVDVARMHLARAELRVASDAASRRYLGFADQR